MSVVKKNFWVYVQVIHTTIYYLQVINELIFTAFCKDPTIVTRWEQKKELKNKNTAYWITLKTSWEILSKLMPRLLRETLTLTLNKWNKK